MEVEQNINYLPFSFLYRKPAIACINNASRLQNQLGTYEERGVRSKKDNTKLRRPEELFVRDGTEAGVNLFFFLRLHSQEKRLTKKQKEFIQTDKLYGCYLKYRQPKTPTYTLYKDSNNRLSSLMFTAIDNLSSMAVDKEVLRDKKQASINSHKIYPNDLTIGSINAGMFDHSPVAVTGHPIKKEPIQKRIPDTESENFVLLHHIKTNQGAKTKGRFQNDDIKDGRRYHFLSKSEPVIHRNNFTDYNNNSNNNLSRSLKHDVPRIVVTNPRDKNGSDGLVLRNPVSKFISRHYGHSSYHGDVYTLSAYNTPSNDQWLAEEFDPANYKHRKSYNSCNVSIDNDAEDDPWCLLNVQSNLKKRSSLPANQISTLDMLVRKNGFRIKGNRENSVLNEVKRGDENQFLEPRPYQTVPKKKNVGVGNCFRSITTSTSSENPDTPAVCTGDEDNSFPTATLRRCHNILPDENHGHSPLRNTCPPDILRKAPEFQYDISNRPISSSVKSSFCNNRNNTSNDRLSNNLGDSSQMVLMFSSFNKRSPSPTTVTGIPKSELAKSFQTMASPPSKRAKSPCQRTIDRVSLTIEKSKSEPDLESFFKKNKSKSNNSSSSLKNIFLPSSPSAMQKTKSSPSNKILSKRWRNKYKENPNNTTAIWRPEVSEIFLLLIIILFDF